MFLLVISGEAFHTNGRNELEVCELLRPFKPMAVTRDRCVWLGRAKRQYRQAAEEGLLDFIQAGSNDDIVDTRSVPGSIVELDVSFSDGKGYEVRPSLVVSRPLLCNAYDMVLFMDISDGEVRNGDYVLQRPRAADLYIRSFVKARLWWVPRAEMDLYNRAWVKRRLDEEDTLGSVRALTAAVEIPFDAGWLNAPNNR